ncbi:MAG: ABC transporter permease [Eubacteriales bacterium]|nr:ABC transporter permease [Eubacteriales bacterium]
MKAILKHELRTYFTGLTGYIFAAFLLLFAGIYTTGICLSSGYANFEYVLGNMSFTFMIIVPILTMRVISAEKKQKTDNLLYSLPLTMTDVVLGKYFAMLILFAVPVVIIGTYPLILRAYGNVNLRMSYAALLGFFLLGAALISVGMFISSLTESQAASAGICFGVMLLNYFLVTISRMVSASAASSVIALVVAAAALSAVFRVMTKNNSWSFTLFIVLLIVILATYVFAGESFSGLVPSVMEKVSLFSRFDDMLDGVLDIGTLVFFVSVTAVFICMTVRSLDKRRWAE